MVSVMVILLKTDNRRDAWAKQRDTPHNEAMWMYVDVLLTVGLLR
jgi:hypothetical protein